MLAVLAAAIGTCCRAPSPQLLRVTSVPVPRSSAPTLSILTDLALEPAVAAAISSRLLFVGTFLPIATAAISTRSSSGWPQIVQSFRNQQPPLPVNIGDSFVYLSRIVYHMRMGYAFSTWNELVLLFGQNIACTALRHRFSGQPRASALLCLARDLGLLAVGTLCMFKMPSKALPLLCLWTVPLAILSYGKQAVQQGSSGYAIPSFAASAVALRWISSFVRVSTTTVIIGDSSMLSNHLVGLLGCSVLLGQNMWYAGRLAPSRLATRKALYSQFFNSRRVPVGRVKRPVLLSWNSLGGFEDDVSDSRISTVGPTPFSRATLRKAFATLDEDGDGTITNDDLVAAIVQATQADGDTCNVEMVRAMIQLGDENNDGVIDFDEYCRIVAADPGLGKFDQAALQCSGLGEGAAAALPQ